tara:strand:+ start:152 stop:859 length:708 start_codon:yes stop_codon:yes gene_type:complete
MKTVDEIWNWATELNPDVQMEELTEYVTIAKNVYKYPDRVLEFQKLLTKWESSVSERPGITTLPLPYWTSTNIIENLLGYGADEYEQSSSEVEYIYFFRNNTQKFKSNESLNKELYTGNCLLPHNDSSDDETESRIFILNLNKRPVRTGFWSMNGEVIGDENLTDELIEYYNDINLGNLEEKTNNGILDNVLNVEYNFNEAIFYNGKAYHQPCIDNYYTKDNPRIMFRIGFDLES